MERLGPGAAPGPEVSVRLAKQDWLEALSHMHPATPLFLGIPTVLVMSWIALIREGLGLIHFAGALLAGLFLWTFLEYLLHRFIFHHQAKSAWGKRLHFILHGVHHDYPNDPTRLVMPPTLTIPLGIISFLLLWAFLGIPLAPAVFTGLVFGYMTYDSVHFMVHHWPMRGPIASAIKRHHMRHHFADPATGYGVSSPLWDWVFRTRRSSKQRRR